MDTWHDLYAHLKWADSLLWAAVDRAPSPLDRRLRDLLSHMHQTQDAFLQLWQGVTRDIPATDSFASRADLRSWAGRFYGAATEIIRDLSADRLSTEVSTPWAERVALVLGRPPTPATFADTLLQVALHGAHHRAQVNTRLRELGLEAPMVDYIAWVWLGRPGAVWPTVPHRDGA